MAPWEIRNKIAEIRGYIASQYFDPSQAKSLYGEISRLERMLKDLENDTKEQT
jgi:hypothetical protein